MSSSAFLNANAVVESSSNTVEPSAAHSNKPKQRTRIVKAKAEQPKARTTKAEQPKAVTTEAWTDKSVSYFL